MSFKLLHFKHVKSLERVKQNSGRAENLAQFEALELSPHSVSLQLQAR